MEGGDNLLPVLLLCPLLLLLLLLLLGGMPTSKKKNYGIPAPCLLSGQLGRHGRLT